MKISIINITAIFTLFLACCLSSCSSKEMPDPVTMPERGEEPGNGNVDRDTSPRVILTISPVSLGYTSSNVREMISTLRIIMISENTLEDGSKETYVEANEYLDFLGRNDGDMFTGPALEANTFRYVFTRHTMNGNKRFYLIANEERVGKIDFQTETEKPAWITAAGEMDLQTFLNHYQADFIPGFNIPAGDGDDSSVNPPAYTQPLGNEFETFLKAIYYTPNFVQEPEGETNQGPIEGALPDEDTTVKTIYLPYTTFYQYNLISEADMENGNSQPDDKVNVVDEHMYLVPCANKFRFQFRNYRADPVIIPTLKLSGIATQMYLIPQINAGDLKKGTRKDTWWATWMENVSRLSYNYPGKSENETFNNAYGWIDDFNIPDTFLEEEEVEIGGELRRGVKELVPSDTPWYVDRRELNSNPITGTPGMAYTGFFYVPESRNMVEQEMYDEDGNPLPSIMVQKYYLTLTMKSGEYGDVVTTRDTQIGNLGSMFRDTNTLITITMRDANDVGAYAQVESWDSSHTNGTVIEDPNPDE